MGYVRRAAAFARRSACRRHGRAPASADLDGDVKRGFASPHEHGHSIYEPGEFLDAPASEPIPEREVSLARRFLNVRTIGSIVFGVALREGFDPFGTSTMTGTISGASFPSATSCQGCMVRV